MIATANNNVVHSVACPANNVVVYASRVHTDYLIQWCPSCCRTGIAPRPGPTTAPTHTPRRFRELPHPDQLEDT